MAEIVGYCTPHAMSVRYGKSNYGYKSTLTKIQAIKHEFGSMTPQERRNYISALELEIGKILLKPEKEWLQDSLDFELSALNLGYCVKA
jgi:hypothetical protein